MKHVHGTDCGHRAVVHEDHVDFLHEGHLEHQNYDDRVDEHSFANDSVHPSKCTGGHQCTGHDASHVHGPGCHHEAVPHDGHTDYLVDGHLHHPHDGHCDNHGKVTSV